ncbi:pentatricopeptide repeat-containing protein [Pyrus ussuriensis x Pyrus communis]|uniref:Pentatricopeptide repeat-containing protein n=1 Tax=Pyrus ussuriensis x Pyrus communis TaxID=2448454 RepID=A0A5N5G616_9ROSA|nr:pentatricopeptide repeat-containing protein [Pyrus ussuriensis x Pyrus communis]
MGMLAPRRFLQKRKKVEAFKDAADEAEQKNWRRLMNEIEKTGSAVSVLKSEKLKDKTIPMDVVLELWMPSSGPEPSAVTYQIILKIFVEGSKFKEAEEIFGTLLNEEKSPLNYDKACKMFAVMSERGVPQSTITYNSLISFENNARKSPRCITSSNEQGASKSLVPVDENDSDDEYDKEDDETYDDELECSSQVTSSNDERKHELIYLHSDNEKNLGDLLAVADS